MAKDLRLDVVTTGDEKGLLSTAEGLDRVADKADKVGHQFEETAVAGAFLAKELEAVRLKQLELSRAFDETGDRSLLKQIQANKRYETQLKNVGHALEDVGKDAAKEGAKLGESLGKNTSKGLSDSLGKLLPEALTNPVVLAAGAAAAPELGIAIGGAVLTGIGLAGIGAGIALSLKAPEVKQALAGFKSEVGATFTDADQPFIEPVRESLISLGNFVKSELGPGIKDTFAALAPEVLVLEAGIEGFIKPLVGGLERAAVAAKPLIDEFSKQDLPAIGNAIGGVFDTIAANAPEAERGLQDLTTLTVGLINNGSRLIDLFSQVSDLGQKFSKWDPTSLHNISKALNAIGINTSDILGTTEKSLIVFNQATDAASAYVPMVWAAASATKALKLEWDALDKSVSNELAIDQAKDAIAGLKDQVDKHSHSLDQDTAAGRKNREAYVGSIQTLEQQRDQLVANGMSATAANKLFQGWIKALDTAAEKAGLSKSAIQALNKQLGLIPSSKTVTIKIRHTGDSGVSLSNSGLKFFAAGGDFRAGQPMVVGENGPEFMVPDFSGTVIPNNAIRQPTAAAGAASGGGGGSVSVFFESTGDQLVDGLLAALRPRIRGQYGGNVTLALGGHV